MKNTDFRTLLYGYFDDMQGVVQMNLGIEDDGRDWFKDEDWRNAIIEDLTDKKFSEDEAKAIIDYNETEKIEKQLQYKMMYYLCALCNPFETIDELKDILTDMNIDVNNFTKEDLDEILKCNKVVDY